MRRHTGQDHFNSRESGKVGINKRRDEVVRDVDVKNIKRLMPYS